MLATALIVFRETLEAALIVSIVMAACKGVPGRIVWVSLGVAAGLLGSGLIAFFAGTLAQLASGMGQELFNATILMAAVLMLSWHTVWMSQHGRELAQNVSAISADVVAQSRPLTALAIVVGVAVLREGSEVVLFLYGIAASTSDSGGALAMVAGGALGMAGGVLVGAALYFGLLRIPLRYFFTATNALLMLVAAGLAAQAAGFLVQADMLPPLVPMLWDSSWLLSESSIVGKVLHVLTGYIARPSGIQFLFYIATLTIVGGLMMLMNRKKLTRAAAPLAVLAFVAGASIASAPPAHADFKVRSPIVDYRELEFEHNGSMTFDKKGSDKDDNGSYTYEVEYGILPFLSIGLESEWASSAEEDMHRDASTLEAMFQLTPQGKYWADLGFFVEYGRPHARDEVDTIEFGPVVQKEVNDVFGMNTLHTLNVLASRQLGANHGDETGLEVAWQSRVRLNPLFEPGFEYYGEVEDASEPGKMSQQEHRIGPMFAGLYRLGFANAKIKYELGYLFGLTSATENGALRWRFELEVPL
jgi:high-affinity iron transporter